jgi:hypothetical protein
MAHSIILHISGEASIAGEVEELPKPGDTTILVLNPRQKDGKDLHYLDNNVSRVIWPINKVSFIEIVDGAGDEKIIGFVRD